MTPAEARAVLAELAAGAAARPGAIRLDLAGPIARLRIDNPTARNAMTAAMMVELADAVDRLAAWDGAAVIVSAGDPRVFCAGGHLGDVRTALSGPDRGERMALAMGTVLDRLLALPIVSVAAVDGLAMGGGAELVTACDHRVFGRGAQIAFVHARLGVAPGWGGAGRLVAHVGRRAALRILTTAASLGADDAAALGLCDLVADGPAEGAAAAFLAPVLAQPVAAVRAAKAQIAAAAGRAPGGLPAEAAAFATVWSGPEHRRALARLPGAPEGS